MTGLNALIAAAAVSLALVTLSADPSTAQSSAYRLEAENPLVQGRSSGTVDLRLVHRPSGKVVDHAVVVENELEMPMNGMSPMSGRVQHVPVPGVATLRFVVSTSMDGEWLLSVTAKVPGEAEPIRAVVPIYVEMATQPKGGSRRWQ